MDAAMYVFIVTCQTWYEGEALVGAATTYPRARRLARNFLRAGLVGFQGWLMWDAQHPNEWFANVPGRDQTMWIRRIEVEAD